MSYLVEAKLYEIKLHGAAKDDGSIELGRLSELAQSLKEIAAGALQMRLVGASFKKGRVPDQLTHALKIRLTNLASGSTVLEVKCDQFKVPSIGIQRNLFDPDLSETLPDQTPVALVIETFKEALTTKDEYKFLDNPLLRKLKTFEKIFQSPNETIMFTNQDSLPPFELRKKDFQQIKILEETTPDPQEILLNGIIDELKYTEHRAGITTADGMVAGVFSEDIDPESIAKHWGKEVTLAGRAHFPPNGKMSFLYMERFYNASDADAYFSKIPKRETVEQQIQRQRRRHKHENRLNEIVGKWPGDASVEDILNGLD